MSLGPTPAVGSAVAPSFGLRYFARMSNQPTPSDLANAAAREAIAARQNAEYDQVLVWADRIMGPGW
jgi:hypothetical protein